MAIIKRNAKEKHTVLLQIVDDYGHYIPALHISSPSKLWKDGFITFNNESIFKIDKRLPSRIKNIVKLSIHELTSKKLNKPDYSELSNIETEVKFI